MILLLFNSCLGGGLSDDYLMNNVAPYGLTASPGNHEVTLEWNIGNNDLIQHIYYTYDVEEASIESPHKLQNVKSPYVHTNLENGITYKYIAVAVNQLWYSDPSNEAEAIPLPNVPEPPTDIRCVPASKRIRISWDAAMETDYYNIYWSDVDVVPNKNFPYPYQNIEATRYIAENLGDGTPLNNGDSYKFVITSNNEAGESLSSAMVECIPQKFEYLQKAYWHTQINETEQMIYAFADPLMLEAYYNTDENTNDDTKFQLTFFEYFVDEELRIIIQDVVVSYSKSGTDLMVDSGQYSNTLEGETTRELIFLFNDPYLSIYDDPATPTISPSFTLKNLAQGNDRYLKDKLTGLWKASDSTGVYEIDINFTTRDVQAQNTTIPLNSDFNANISITNTSLSLYPNTFSYPNTQVWEDLWTFFPRGYTSTTLIFGLFPIQGEDHLIFVPFTNHGELLTTAQGLWWFEKQP